MSQQRAPPPRRCGSKRSDPTEHLRNATNTSLPRSLKVPSFRDPEMEKYCKSLRQSYGFKSALETHEGILKTHVEGLPDFQITGSSETRVKPSPYEPPWTHQSLGRWIDCDEHRKGVEVSLYSRNGTESFKTEFNYERPPTEILEEYMRFDPGTKLAVDIYQNDWETAMGKVVNDLDKHGIDEPLQALRRLRARSNL